MKVIELLKNTDKTLFSFELLPPLRGGNIESVYKVIDPLIGFNPININITYHQQEVVYKKLPSGLLQKKTVRKRPGTVAISAAIKYRYPQLEVVPHLICGGFTKSETEYALIDLHFLGIENLLVLRGDPPKSQRLFQPDPEGHQFAIDLIEQITNLNKGIYQDDELRNKTATDFSVGVAGYPEKHFEAANMDADLQYLKEKVDSGADYIITQMFFDNKVFFDFVERCRNFGIEVPIIPGLKPISSMNDLRLLPLVFHIDIPEGLAAGLRKCKTNEAAIQLGIKWSVKQSLELKDYGVPALHYFTIGVTDNIRQIAGKVF
ncbi:MAG: methylenetetrahydrofolate reductase [NAD(P)H] [Bacteroidetes bacterium 4484_276]|nr:MAG: methylenetetrahydrofolate reductase [NAD(P)H] [Bacteroidetes bacterium 4484_276]OYT13229.1 MAG: methylenetetrahydrofolate reductase [NAD(P)H] [Bacteroidetes bacterium 4572_114]